MKKGKVKKICMGCGKPVGLNYFKSNEKHDGEFVYMCTRCKCGQTNCNKCLEEVSK